MKKWFYVFCRRYGYHFVHTGVSNQRYYTLGIRTFG